MPQCSKCGTLNLETAKFCANCGAVLQNQSSSLPPQQLNIGSRVSFVATDGKTHTGTIKEIKGDQYRIKYDSSDFETWLNKDQFSIVAVTSTQPVYIPAPNPNVSYTKTSASAARRSASPLFITHLGFWGSVMIIIGFFTDWLNFDEGGISGNDILSSAKGIINATNRDNAFLVMFIAIAVILFSAVICLFYTIFGFGRAAFLLFKILPLLT
ncbi:MAG: zinc ribbon domain-containing protein, partial [Chitinophagales bacterium]